MKYIDDGDHFGENFDDLACNHSYSFCENWYWKFLIPSFPYRFIWRFYISLYIQVGKFSVDVFTRTVWEYLSNNLETLVIS